VSEGPGAPATTDVGRALRGRRVLVTGHTGFKGSWLCLWLEALGARVAGLALPPPTRPSNYVASGVRDRLERELIVDIRDAEAVGRFVREGRPEVILHLAAQALVREGYASPLHTFGTNVMGTAHVLEAVRAGDFPCAVVVVTSDKCYSPAGNRALAEEDPLGGHDPYSASKSAAEMVSAAYRASFFPPDRADRHGVRLATARAGNVIGGGDWGRDRLVPDIVRALTAGVPVRLRHPEFVRPWQHVLEPLSGYLLLAAAMLEGSDPELCSAWNFGPERDSEETVAEVTTRILEAWGGGRWEPEAAPDAAPEMPVLRLSSAKARRRLGWTSRWRLDQAVERTARWHRRFAEGGGADLMTGACLADIEAYGTLGSRGPAVAGRD
jgi:CDP-glucose 4,6-dehydratase